ncbi:hypothetical protein BDZ94DRAFT_321018 [Collybia nuda]|uniref:Uncharacterized protein n=1 Tax=Collybia nuda TaxID=64659 RepID=A0A9P5XWC1_9AGAR|nr:hypothetical protein BDZ94DRAFT_321018 [Collybia nuda]
MLDCRLEVSVDDFNNVREGKGKLLPTLLHLFKFTLPLGHPQETEGVNDFQKDPKTKFPSYSCSTPPFLAAITRH